MSLWKSNLPYHIPFKWLHVDRFREVQSTCLSVSAENGFLKYKPVTLLHFLNASLLDKKNKEIWKSFPFYKGEWYWGRCIESLFFIMCLLLLGRIGP